MELAARRAGLCDAARRRVQRPRAAGHLAARGALAAGQTTTGARPHPPTLSPPELEVPCAVPSRTGRMHCSQNTDCGLQPHCQSPCSSARSAQGSRLGACGARARTRQRAAGRCGGAGASPSRRRARAGRGRAASAHRTCARPFGQKAAPVLLLPALLALAVCRLVQRRLSPYACLADSLMQCTKRRA